MSRCYSSLRRLSTRRKGLQRQRRSTSYVNILDFHFLAPLAQVRILRSPFPCSPRQAQKEQFNYTGLPKIRTPAPLDFNGEITTLASDFMFMQAQKRDTVPDPPLQS